MPLTERLFNTRLRREDFSDKPKEEGRAFLFFIFICQNSRPHRRSVAVVQQRDLVRLRLARGQQHGGDVRPGGLDEIHPVADQRFQRLFVVRLQAHGEQTRLTARPHERRRQVRGRCAQAEQAGRLRRADQRVDIIRQRGQLAMMCRSGLATAMRAASTSPRPTKIVSSR